MIKIYEKIKKYIKENFKFIITYLLIFLIFTVKLPYYISAPGGLIDTKDRIKADESFNLKGSLNMAYVTEIHASIPTLIWSMIASDWDISKEEDALGYNETEKDMNFRNKLLLKEANKKAEITAYNYSNVDYEITNNKIFVTYVTDDARTDLVAGDRIVDVDGKKVIDKKYLLSYIKSKNVGDIIKFKVINNNKKLIKKATIVDIEGEPKVGIIINEDFDINTNIKLNFNFSSSEYGPSGGLMTTLAIYSNINKVDLTDGKKIAGTGTIEDNGFVGEISGVKYNVIGAVKNKADVFLVPKGDNYNEAKKIKSERGYKIDLVPVETFDDALNYLLD